MGVPREWRFPGKSLPRSDFFNSLLDGCMCKPGERSRPTLPKSGGCAAPYGIGVGAKSANHKSNQAPDASVVFPIASQCPLVAHGSCLTTTAAMSAHPPKRTLSASAFRTDGGSLSGNRLGYAGYGEANILDLAAAHGRPSMESLERFFAVRSLGDRIDGLACPAPVQNDYRGHIDRVVDRRWSNDIPASGHVINNADSGTK